MVFKVAMTQMCYNADKYRENSLACLTLYLDFNGLWGQGVQEKWE